jgi:hypothetical protein
MAEGAARRGESERDNGSKLASADVPLANHVSKPIFHILIS